MSTNIQGNSNLTLKSVYDILGLTFIIPEYQRGYRWTKTEVEQMLDDIWTFHNRTNKQQGEFYCLQPIVVKEIKENEYEVIDGQQRLTTIHIILSYMENVAQKTLNESHGKEKFSIAYKTRNNSNNFLNNIINADQNDKNNNIDFYHMSEAYETINKWFNNHKLTDDDKFGFRSTLLGQLNKPNNFPVVFIWYELNNNETEAIDVFTRLNIGKIPLTNSELIKALLLKNANFPENIANLKQIQIATEWDLIEKSLQDDNLWYFIYNTSNPLKYENRIEYILDLISKKEPDHEFYFTFIYFFKEISENKKAIDDVWLEIKKFYFTLEEWYKDFELYHYVGFLIDSGLKIRDLLNVFKEKPKEEFKGWLKEKIKEQINCSENEIEELEYGDKRIKKILLLFNIQTILNSKNTDFRFSFKHYKSTPWDVEHVRSRTDIQIIGTSKQKEWLQDVRNILGLSNENNAITNYNNIDGYLKKIKDSTEIDENDFKNLIEAAFKYLTTKNENMLEEKFSSIFQIAQKYFKENEQLEDIDKISNLALLDSEINRSYKNAFFPVKRKIIVENDKNGKYIPIVTKNLFLKYYTKNASNAMYWTKNDAESYLKAIKEVLKEFLK